MTLAHFRCAGARPGYAATHRRAHLVALLLMVGGLLPVALPAATYRVGGGSGCTHATIQAAVNSAAANPGFDTIRLTRSLAYNAQAVVVDSDDAGLEVIGGYADCQASSTTAPRTLVSGAGGSAAAVFRLRGTASVFLVNLEISGGDNTVSGGGIEITGGPKTIWLSNLLVRGNQGSRGGGISAVGTAASSNDLQLLIDGDTSINNNASTGTSFQFGGGGIYCERANLRIAGSTYLLQNTSANHGGGIFARDCAVDIGSSGLLGGILLNNHAAGDGGGLHAALSASGVDIYTVDPASPATILNNTAGGAGGGLYINVNARVSLYDAIIRGNIAARGGAVAAADSDGSSVPARFLMQGSLLGAPSGARNCRQRERCNRISDNRAQNAGGTAQGGAALHLNNSSGDEFGTVAVLRGTRIDGNVGQSLLDMQFNGDASFDGALIDGNTTSGALFDTGDAFEQNLVIAATTIAGNSIGTGQPVIRASNRCAIDGAVYSGTHVYRSIVWQPGHDLLTMSGIPVLDCFQYVLANDLDALPASTLNRTGDPLFVNPAGRDYRLRAASPALDYAPAQPSNSTRDRGPRVIDDPSASNAFGAQDLGAYEIDTLFADGFDPAAAAGTFPNPSE